MQLVLEVWKEVGRGAKPGDSLARIGRLIGERIPFDALVIRRFDARVGRLETLEQELRSPLPGLPPPRTELTSADVREIASWCREGRVCRLPPDRPKGGPAALVPSDLGAEVLAGPLAVEDGPVGVLLLARAEPGFTDEHVRLVRELLEPLAFVLRNAERLQDLERHRDAVEADKRALLSRLERQDIADSLIGSESGLREVIERVDQVAGTDAPVLLLGETGTGKEVISRRIHARSRRADGPIVRVNCGASPPELVDSELFGHERGSFTGAITARKGWFERADGGTLFLDEIAELPAAAQVRLLRILQDGSLDRVGAQRTVMVDVRVIAATHADLPAMVARGEFRQDLWYRIGVFPIRLPPLRERIQDIPALAAQFAWRAGKRLGFAPLVPSPEDIALLVGYAWPGNVRELAAVIERAAILGDGRRLEVGAALGVTAQTPVGPKPEPPGPAGGGTDFPSLDGAMRAHIELALVRTRGRIEGAQGAAALLQMNPHTLRARMRRLRIDWSRYKAARSGENGRS
ncbi:MAG: sigma 54-interacting transcriptional regulator [Deltaproteobacteria bacterium]|nr:sigma 54-interacting transcriptional regulator [Deltaproteobacteria bacterium]